MSCASCFQVTHCLELRDETVITGYRQAAGLSNSMHRLTASLLLVLLLAGTLAPVALAISVAPPHACCLRKPQRDKGSHDFSFRAPNCCRHDCCRSLTVSHWSYLWTWTKSYISPPSATLRSELHPFNLPKTLHFSRPVRAPPKFSIS